MVLKRQRSYVFSSLKLTFIVLVYFGGPLDRHYPNVNNQSTARGSRNGANYSSPATAYLADHVFDSGPAF